MSPSAAIFALSASTIAASASAQVTAVITETSAMIQYVDSVDFFSGEDISGSVPNVQGGNGGSFASTSRVEPGFVEFRNGNSASGIFTRLMSRTIVDITFTNDGDTAVTPLLQSTITPEGMGLFVAPLTCLPYTVGCLPGLPGVTANFQDFGFTPDATGDGLAGGAFLFRITANGQTMYELDGSVALVRDQITGVNSLVTDLADAAAVLTGFRLNSPAGSETEFGFAWDATDISVPFPDGTSLQPGESATLRYETITETFSNSIDLGLENAVIAYSAFGDPIGRRGGGQRAPFDAETGLSYDPFRFIFPVYADGVLTYVLEPSVAAVPEPAGWTLMIAGFGAIGGALRRGRAHPRLAARG